MSICFKKHKLVFNETNILDTTSDIHVMMDWETDIMREHAKTVCHNKGDILEIGFGMGISANHIQSFKPKSHTIIEIHPQILECLYEWSKNKPNVKIIEGDWKNKLNELEKYDGIFFDTFLDKTINKFYLTDYLKSDGVFSFYNDRGMIQYPKFNCEYIEINVKPDKNKYFNENKYYIPIIKNKNN